MARPTTIPCEKCFFTQDVTQEVNYLTGMWDYACSNPVHGETPYIWSVIPPSNAETSASRDSFLDGLGIYDDLLLCIHAGDPWLEYGVIEDRYRRDNPDEYAQLIEKYSHSARNSTRGGPDVQPSRSRKTSSRLSGALSVLAKAGLIDRAFGPASGYWSYNPRISRWAPLPSPAKEDLLTWSEYAAGEGLDPTRWELP